MEDSKASQTIENISQDQIVKKRRFFQCRYFVALMGFFTFAILNVQWISTSVSIVAMVNNSKIKSLTNSTTNDKVSCVMNIRNTTNDSQPEAKGEFDWDPQIQGYVLGAGNLGYVITHMPGGLLAEMVGAKTTLLSGILIASVAHLVSPFASWAGSYYMIAVQLLRGFGHGVLPPANFVLTANWIPRHERGVIMTFIMSGFGLGTIVGGVASGALCATDFLSGWPSVYYIFGSLGILLSLCYALFVYNSPSQHPRITDSERKYIIENQETDLSKKRPLTPWRAILTSVPFYAMVAGVFGNFWGVAHFLSVHPTFLGTILHFNIQENGLFSSVSFALQTVITLLSSWMSDWLIRNNIVGLSKVRKGFNMLCCLGYSLSVFGIYMAGCNKMLSTVFSILAIGCGGFGNAGARINAMDLSPSFAGSLIGLSSIGATSTMYIVPVVVGHLTKHEQTLEQWNKMFFISIAIVMTSGIIFCVSGSAEVQPWNFPPEEKNKKKMNENGIVHKVYSHTNPNYIPDFTTHL